MIARPADPNRTAASCPICRAAQFMEEVTGIAPAKIVASAAAKQADVSGWCEKHRRWLEDAKPEIEGTPQEEE